MSKITQHFKVSKQSIKKVNKNFTAGATPTKSKSAPSVSKQFDEDPVFADKERLLCQFDMEYKYGPSQDITRLQRWNRAANLGLNPPLRVKEIILSDEEKYVNPLWNGHPILN